MESPSGRRLAIAMAVLLVTDLVGGVLAVTSDVNTWAQAWGGDALLAAPAPMILAQVVCTVVAVLVVRRWAAIPAYLLALACFVSVISGFFDGGLGNDELSGALVAFQVLLLVVTAAVGFCATVRASLLRRGEPAA